MSLIGAFPKSAGAVQRTLGVHWNDPTTKFNPATMPANVMPFRVEQMVDILMGSNVMQRKNIRPEQQGMSAVDVLEFESQKAGRPKPPQEDIMAAVSKYQSLRSEQLSSYGYSESLSTDYFLENSHAYSTSSLEAFAAGQSPDVVIEIQEALKPFFKKMFILSESNPAIPFKLIDEVSNKVTTFQERGVPDEFIQIGIASAMVEAGVVDTMSKAASMVNPAVGGMKTALSLGKGLFSILSSLFSRLGGSALQNLKQWGVGKVLSFFGIDPNHGIAKFITIALAKTSITEIPKLFTDCRFLVQIMSKSIVAYVSQSITGGGTEGGVFASLGIANVAKTALERELTSGKIFNAITNAIADPVCGKMAQTGQSLAKSADTIVSKLNGGQNQQAAPQQAQQALQ